MNSPAWPAQDRCLAKFLTSRHVRMQSNILPVKYAEKTDEGLGFGV